MNRRTVALGGVLGVLLTTFMLANKIEASGQSTAPAPENARTQLPLAQLLDGELQGPVRMSSFAKPVGARVATQRLEGRLTLESATFNGGFQVVRNRPYNLAIDDAVKSLPSFDFTFVQDNGALIPVQRGRLAGQNPDWEIILEPGEVWDESVDRGYSRASFPFSLQERNANCLHNGVMSFAFRADGAISRVYFQISSETCAYFKFNAWGSAIAHYSPGPVTGAAQLKDAYRAEVRARLPVRPLSELVAANAGVIEAGFALAARGDGDLPTLYGVVVDGVNYLGACDTRMGRYPYCDVLDLPSYSTAKTVVAAIGLMRLEALWPGARNALISDFVPQCATADWSGVTFENALDMVTGVYNSRDTEVDENSDESSPFFRAQTHADRIAFACGHYHRKSLPGKAWVYHTTDTYILGTAMQAFVQRRLGSGADFYRDILDAQLWRTLDLSPLLGSSLRTNDSARQIFAGYGLTFHIDDIARIAAFLAPSGGRIDSVPILDQEMLARAMQRDPRHRGMSAGYPHFAYVDGVWARDVAPILHCARETWVPFMSGFGGISVVMLPNGTIYYYFGDSQVWDWSSAATEINKIRPICA